VPASRAQIHTRLSARAVFADQAAPNQGCGVAHSHVMSAMRRRPCFCYLVGDHGTWARSGPWLVLAAWFQHPGRGVFACGPLWKKGRWTRYGVPEIFKPLTGDRKFLLGRTFTQTRSRWPVSLSPMDGKRRVGSDNRVFYRGGLLSGSAEMGCVGILRQARRPRQARPTEGRLDLSSAGSGLFYNELAGPHTGLFDRSPDAMDVYGEGPTSASKGGMRRNQPRLEL